MSCWVGVRYVTVGLNNYMFIFYMPSLICSVAAWRANGVFYAFSLFCLIPFTSLWISTQHSLRFTNIKCFYEILQYNKEDITVYCKLNYMRPVHVWVCIISIQDNVLECWWRYRRGGHGWQSTSQPCQRTHLYLWSNHWCRRSVVSCGDVR